MDLLDIPQDIIANKVKSIMGQYIKEFLEKRKISELFDEFCAGKEGQVLAQNQGFADSIDFYVLTHELRTELIDNILLYYCGAEHMEAYRKRQDFYKKVQFQVGAESDIQKKYVTHFLNHIYQLAGHYLLQGLGREDRIVMALGMDYTDVQCSKIAEEILAQVKNNLSDDMAQKPSIDDFIAYQQMQKGANGAYRLLQINDSLFPALAGWDGTRYTNKNGKMVPLFSCLSENWASGEWKHLLLIGEGGTGKTVALLRLWDKLLKEGICSIYIPLHSIIHKELSFEAYKNAIKEYITDNIWYGDEKKMEYFIRQAMITSEHPKLILLLDGFNEIPEVAQRIAAQVIKKWMLYPGVQVIISSRYDFHREFPIETLENIRIEPLSREQITFWFSLCQMPLPGEDEKLWELLKTPFMLTLYTQVEARYNQGCEADFIKWKQPADTAACLMWNFMQCQILKIAYELVRPDAYLLKTIIASTYILPYICWKMEWMELFTAEPEELLQWIDEAVILYRNKWTDYPEPGIRLMEVKFGKIEWDSLDFMRILTDGINLLVHQNKGCYSLMHQNFRDFLAAVHLCHMAETDNRVAAQSWDDRPFSDRVVLYLAEWMPEDVTDNMYQSLRGKEISEGRYIFFNLIRVLRIKKSDDLSRIDFSDMDLRTVRLNGAKLVDGSQRACFRNARINFGTLIMQGHNDKIYYIAFSEDGRQLISISTYEIRIWDIRTGSCIHEITESPYLIGGYYQYNEPQFYKKLKLADGKEIVWIGENDTCGGNFIDFFENLFQPDGDWTGGQGKNAYRHCRYKPMRAEAVESIIRHSVHDERISIQEDSLTIFYPDGRQQTLYGNKAMITCAGLSKDMKYCAAGQEDGSICIWNLERGDISREFPASIHGISFFEDCDSINVGQTSGIVMLWKSMLDELRPVCTHVLDGRKSPVTLISKGFVPGGKDIIIISHEDDVAEIWNVSENRMIRKMERQQYVFLMDSYFLGGKTTEGIVWYMDVRSKKKKIIWKGVPRSSKVWSSCSGTIFRQDEGKPFAQFNINNGEYHRYDPAMYGYRDAPGFDCQGGILFINYRYLQAPKYIYTILNLNIFGCDFTGAIFETQDLAIKVMSNGGIVDAK